MTSPKEHILNSMLKKPWERAVGFDSNQYWWTNALRFSNQEKATTYCSQFQDTLSSLHINTTPPTCRMHIRPHEKGTFIAAFTIKISKQEYLDHIKPRIHQPSISPTTSPTSKSPTQQVHQSNGPS